MYISNWTFRPAAGKHAEVIENCKKAAEIWQIAAQTSVAYSIFRVVMWAACHLLRCLIMQKRTAKPVML